MEHNTFVQHFDGTMYELADAIGNLRYDALNKFLVLLSNKIRDDANADKGRNRDKLSKVLKQAHEALDVTSLYISAAWIISKPYMEGVKEK